MDAQRTYESPKVKDLGDLATVTLANGFTDAEDGGSKLLIHHSAPMFP